MRAVAAVWHSSEKVAYVIVSGCLASVNNMAGCRKRLALTLKEQVSIRAWLHLKLFTAAGCREDAITAQAGGHFVFASPLASILFPRSVSL